MGLPAPVNRFYKVIPVLRLWLSYQVNKLFKIPGIKIFTHRLSKVFILFILFCVRSAVAHCFFVNSAQPKGIYVISWSLASLKMGSTAYM